MYPTAEEFVSELTEVEWFTNVGKLTGDSECATVTTWKSAIKLVKSRHNRNVSIEAQNTLTQILHDEFMEQYRDWNSHIAYFRPIIDEMISRKTIAFPFELADTDKFSMKVRQDIVGACMELHFQELVAPPHKFDWCKWYLKGHAPVGWEGEFPEGRLIVF